MDTKEAAAKLDGNQYGEEGSRGLFEAMRKAGLVAVFGYSDDGVELRGSITEEIGAYGGTTIYVTSDGLIESECDNDDCPHEARRRKRAATIDARYCETKENCWTFETKIPHEPFRILEGDELFCLGIVFALVDVASFMSEPVQP